MYQVTHAKYSACQGTDWNWDQGSVGHAVERDLGSLTKTLCGIRVGSLDRGWSALVFWPGPESVSCKRCRSALGRPA